VEWLLAEGGADIEKEDGCGQTALELSAKIGDFATVRWLLADGGSTDVINAMLWAATEGQLAIMQWLLAEWCQHYTCG
jgi:ankyrin repeat protein